MKRQARRSERKALATKRAVSDVTASAPIMESNLFWVTAIFVVAWVLRLGYLVQIDAIPLFYHLAGDGRTYDEWAQRIAGGDWLGTGVFYQAPLYPYFLGILELIFGH